MKSYPVDIQFMPDHTRRLFLQLAGTPFFSQFSLVGGTALSIQLKHRLSEDLDFIYDGDQLNINAIKRNISRLFPIHKILRQDASWQIDFIIDGVKLTFFSTGAVALPFHVLKYTFPYQSIRICTAQIISSLKMSTIAQRNTIRDYYDLYILVKYHFSLKEIYKQTKELIPNLSPITYTETLLFTADIEEDSLSNHLHPSESISKYEMVEFFRQEIRKIVDDI